MKSYILIAVLYLTSTLVHGEQDPHAHHRSLSNSGSKTQVNIPEITLTDSKGNMQKIKQLIGERIAIIDFVYTNCTTICPILSRIMKDIETELGPKMATNYVLISITVDPANDSPEVLATYARKLGASSSWHWLTGSPSRINRTLRAFGIPTRGRPEDHPPNILVGKVQSNSWKRWTGIASAQEITAAARELHNE